jgi:hypothetical protein
MLEKLSPSVEMEELCPIKGREQVGKMVVRSGSGDGRKFLLWSPAGDMSRKPLLQLGP